ncbi:MAG: hypothetical protein LBK73_08585 [Treponema sp.]|nr:hypothetical protein [Treponema sp.]
MKTTRWDIYGELKTAEDMRTFIEASIADAENDGDPSPLACGAHALSVVAKARGVLAVSRDTGSVGKISPGDGFYPAASNGYRDALRPCPRYPGLPSRYRVSVLTFCRCQEHRNMPTPPQKYQEITNKKCIDCRCFDAIENLMAIRSSSVRFQPRFTPISDAANATAQQSMRMTPAAQADPYRYAPAAR